MNRRKLMTLALGSLIAACAPSGPARLRPGSTLILTRHGNRTGSEEILNSRGRRLAGSASSAAATDPGDPRGPARKTRIRRPVHPLHGPAPRGNRKNLLIES
ncbi:MAG: hypothetical protein ACX93U_01210 [Salipiger thiooxidans]|uniref:hypothetical protein n=1 Tax=Salipiger thiooxidans TaxID=282683 RepID=UPI001CFA83BA|nr:hypothetical protein [Salipiger thiooxidans]